MEEVCGGDAPYLAPEELEGQHMEKRSKSIRMFKNVRKMGGEEYSLSFLNTLEAELNACFENYVKLNNGKNMFRSFRTPAVFFLIIVLNYFFQELFVLLRLDLLASLCSSLLGLLLITLALWTYIRYTGDMREFGQTIDSFAEMVWMQFLLPASQYAISQGAKHASLYVSSNLTASERSFRPKMTVQRQLPESLSPSTDVSEVGEESDMESDYEFIGEVDVEETPFPDLGHLLNQPVIINLVDYNPPLPDPLPVLSPPLSAGGGDGTLDFGPVSMSRLDSEMATTDSSDAPTESNHGRSIEYLGDNSVLIRQCMAGVHIPEELIPAWVSLMKFTPRGTLEGVGRSGCITEWAGRDVQLQTPMLLIHTVAGHIPHLSHEVLRLTELLKLAKQQTVWLNAVGGLIGALSTLKETRMSIKHFVGLPDDGLVFFSFNDPAISMRSGYNDDSSSSVFTRSGRVKVGHMFTVLLLS
ncbi:hypothetical protein D918_02413 [Trichuris suis]|nr:hypothetical protein D918_02413 [Trichuris suis]